MLVLTRKKGESVILGEEVTLTVEEICGSDGQRIFAAGVRLGFESPRYVSICRSELRPKGSRGGGGVKSGTASPTQASPTQPRPGRLVEVPDAQVRLRIQVPQKIPVCCNGTPLVGLDPHGAGLHDPGPKCRHGGRVGHRRRRRCATGRLRHAPPPAAGRRTGARMRSCRGTVIQPRRAARQQRRRGRGPACLR